MRYRKIEQPLTGRWRRDRLAEKMTLAQLLTEYFKVHGLTIAEAARRADNMSWQQMNRLSKGYSVYIQPATIDALVKLGLDRDAVALATYGLPAPA